jgi:hypothetical protein
VFAAGSLTFGGSLVEDPQLQAIVRNALDECLAAPLGGCLARLRSEVAGRDGGNDASIDQRASCTTL